jgi:hypothetical protein
VACFSGFHELLGTKNVFVVIMHLFLVARRKVHTSQKG